MTDANDKQRQPAPPAPPADPPTGDGGDGWKYDDGGTPRHERLTGGRVNCLYDPWHLRKGIDEGKVQ